MNPNPRGFATNRFGKTENALDFVERFCASGAVDVPPGDFTMHTRRDHISLWWD